MPAYNEAVDDSEQVKIQLFRGKVVVSGKEAEPVKVDAEGKKRWCHDQEPIEPLSIDGEDFSKLLETGRLEYYADSFDRRVCLHTMIKYPEIKKTG